jgi:hypothetical protein
MTRKHPTPPDLGCADEPYLFFTPMLMLAAALCCGAIVVMARDAPAGALEAQQHTCPHRNTPCPTS